MSQSYGSTPVPDFHKSSSSYTSAQAFLSTGNFVLVWVVLTHPVRLSSRITAYDNIHVDSHNDHSQPPLSCLPPGHGAKCRCKSSFSQLPLQPQVGIY